MISILSIIVKYNSSITMIINNIMIDDGLQYRCGKNHVGGGGGEVDNYTFVCVCFCVRVRLCICVHVGTCVCVCVFFVLLFSSALSWSVGPGRHNFENPRTGMSGAPVGLTVIRSDTIRGAASAI